ncbi:DUF7149 domain-containing protein [Mucilaginibacter sp. McL0603]|uniref:type IIG restriction enzyme/methyltransferase n=1 Tax=Mucilaginibacter sp. McL0603 TaxID=3415670 RepID=UPI003CE77DBA
MNLKSLTIKQSLNKAYLKEKISRSDIELFKTHFSDLLGKINDKGDEEHLKSLVADFLKFTWYKDSHQINPIGKNDLVIHTGKSPNDPYGVILEVKSPSNKTEMVSDGKTNAKALHELILYYLDERITRNRNELKQLIITNIYEWYIIDANEFDKKIYRNTGIKKLYDLKKSDGKDNPWFYDELKKFFDAHPDLSIETTFFDIRDYKKPALNNNPDDDKKLIPLFKILSPVHLLKLSFTNDSNTLQPKFYSELLHIIGLYEYKEGSKKLINRKKEGERNAGSLLENAIINLDSHDKISRLDRASQYGETYQERLYNVALELVITWINRILFLKLLEAQLLNYHKGDKTYNFLNKDKIKDFDDLDKLFFRVLAKRIDERSNEILNLFSKVPYLNSSLFEPTELEHQTLFINGLEDFVPLPVPGSTILKDEKGKILKGSLNTIDYLFDFLNAYDFSSEGAEEIQEDNKTLINASVLGLIFEKINGYKDGSFFTPGFITMYMCRETIRRAVVQKFKDVKGWNISEYYELYDLITDRTEANAIINSLKICDPAVGSGHFLVSALNEIIAIKSDLNILMSADGRTLRDYHIEVVNDELIVTDENSDPFKYNYQDLRSQVVQQTLFHEKQTIIENCLFGVDINPNSVKICRLRLWIELLKNAYYKPDTGGGVELETLPNIDINIKVGNSLISRFALDADLKQALKKSKYSIDAYKIAVQTYRESTNKEQKREMEKLISIIKNDFRTEISATDPKIKLLDKKGNELYVKYTTNNLFNEKLTAAQLKDRKKLEGEVNKLSEEIAEIKNNKVYENAFEWRFEFPEVLNEDGDFVGFDVIIGNPPYINALELKKMLTKAEYDYYKSNFKTAKGTVDIYIYFFELAVNITRDSQFITYITPNRYLSASYGFGLRSYLIERTKYISVGDYSHVKVFKEASTYPILTFLKKEKVTNIYQFSSFTFIDELTEFEWRVFDSSTLNCLSEFIWGFVLSDKFTITKKIIDQSIPLYEAGTINATSTASEADIYHNYINETKGFKLINTGTIDKYANTWGVEKLVDKGSKFTTPFLPIDDKLLSKNRFELYSSPKLLIAKIAINTEVFFDSKGEYASINTNCLHAFKEDFNPYYILGWLNSKLFQYTYKCFFEGLKMAGGYMLYSAPNLSNMYIKKSDEFEQKPIIEIAQKITNTKNSNPYSDTSDLEKKIDQLVYQLYDLTEEEIKIVEGEG